MTSNADRTLSLHACSMQVAADRLAGRLLGPEGPGLRSQPGHKSERRCRSASTTTPTSPTPTGAMRSIVDSAMATAAQTAIETPRRAHNATRTAMTRAPTASSPVPRCTGVASPRRCRPGTRCLSLLVRTRTTTRRTASPPSAEMAPMNAERRHSDRSLSKLSPSRLDASPIEPKRRAARCERRTSATLPDSTARPGPRGTLTRSGPVPPDDLGPGVLCAANLDFACLRAFAARSSGKSSSSSSGPGAPSSLCSVPTPTCQSVGESAGRSRRALLASDRRGARRRRQARLPSPGSRPASRCRQASPAHLGRRG